MADCTTLVTMVVSARNSVTTVMVAVLVLVVHTCITHLAMHTADLDLIHTTTSIGIICTITELMDINNTLTENMGGIMDKTTVTILSMKTTHMAGVSTWDKTTRVTHRETVAEGELVFLLKCIQNPGTKTRHMTDMLNIWTYKIN